MSWKKERKRFRRDAAELSANGYVVHKLCRPTHDCGSPGKVPHSWRWNQGGSKTAEWCHRSFRRPSNLGVRLSSDFLVVDCDKKAGKNGVSEFHSILEMHGLSVPEPTLVSGSGGTHYWYRTPDGVRLRTNAKLGKLIDTRTYGVGVDGKQAKVGQVVVPPSLHVNGELYAWTDGVPPPAHRLPEAPDFIIKALEWKAPPPPNPEPQYRLPPKSVNSRGFDKGTAAYWDACLNRMARMSEGGDGRQSRNTNLYGLGCTARGLDNAHPQRTTPGQAVMRNEAIDAAKAAGLKEDLSRQFDNGWRAAASKYIWPSEDRTREAEQKLRDLRSRSGRGS